MKLNEVQLSEDEYRFLMEYLEDLIVTQQCQNCGTRYTSPEGVPVCYNCGSRCLKLMG